MNEPEVHYSVPAKGWIRSAITRKSDGTTIEVKYPSGVKPVDWDALAEQVAADVLYGDTNRKPDRFFGLSARYGECLTEEPEKGWRPVVARWLRNIADRID